MNHQWRFSLTLVYDSCASFLPGVSHVTRVTQAVNKSLGVVANPVPGTFAYRRRQAANINAVYEGRFEAQVLTLLQSRYDKDTYECLKLEAGVSQRLNIMRDVLDKADVTISEGADYGLTGLKEGQAEEGGAEDKAEANLENMMRVLSFTDVLQQVSRKCWYHKGICAMPRISYSQRIGKRVADICLYDPSRYDLVKSDPDAADWDVLVIYNTDGTERTLYTSKGWAEQKLNQRTQTWETETMGDNPGGGGIDAVIFKPTKLGLWWEESYGSQLAESTIFANAAETFVDWLMSTQVKMFAGQLDSMGPGQRLIQGGGLNLGNGSTGGVIDFQTDLPQLIETFVTRERDNAAKAIGLSGSEWSSAVAPATSGVAERIKFWARDRNGIQRRTWLLPAAKELYWMTIRKLYTELPMATPIVREDSETGAGTLVLQVLPIEGFDGEWSDTGGPTPPPFTPPNPADVLPPYVAGVSFHAQPIDLMIDVRDVSYPDAPLERIAIEENDLKHGYTTEAALQLERNPDLGTIEAAKIENAKNKADNAGVVNAVIGTSISMDLKGVHTAPTPATNAGVETTPAITDAAGKVDAGTSAASTLNGAQIQAALEVVTLFADKRIAHITAVELLVAVGIDRTQAEKMASAEDSREKPKPVAPVAPVLTPQVNQGEPK
jgi:hypothetical protein